MKKPISEIEVQISHPFSLGDYVPLETWIAWGPGPRKYVAPISARDQRTKQLLPMSAIPLRFRNNFWSRLLIRWGYLQDPWLGVERSARG